MEQDKQPVENQVDNQPEENQVENQPVENQVEKPAVKPVEVRLVDVAIKDENTALNVMVGFLTLAHKRGIFTIDESAKIWECIKVFQKHN
jgi:hypothetical protein